MIKVNLTPDEELANPLWWLPEAACAIILCVAAFSGVFYYLGQLKQQIVTAQIEYDALTASTAQLQNDVKKYDEIRSEREKLASKVEGLRAITLSKVKRYRPLILLEHLQNLKPEGMWFTDVDMLRDSSVDLPPAPAPAPQATAANNPNPTPATPPQRRLERDDVAIVGAAFDNLLVAEFMSTLKTTQAQETDSRDLRTLVYFERVELSHTETEANNASFDANNLQARTAAISYPVVKFSLRLKYGERSENSGSAMKLSLRHQNDADRVVRK